MQFPKMSGFVTSTCSSSPIIQEREGSYRHLVLQAVAVKAEAMQTPMGLVPSCKTVELGVTGSAIDFRHLALM